ncbi:hypothetical protein ASPZODRAFT_163393 [Penicilliopsis zonata CBS 506.65]|uniref:Large ribosomal subunit protein mL49 n=1 Tax=Penicilliopsis zonata CBS 506.65 TaxID=1073090 RepID=A0A1L9SWZ9_9EURO|nr:hypothetical protein ASPZODRAFT_163393 [Penicilliopsis zonata CBS 506.65]OJJ51583.1 hypothetical protein ASPZODRAFT_163393 [Penicilliopsis zonata CBS 506.65]
MASLSQSLAVSSAIRQRSAAMPLRLSSSQCIFASRACRSLSTKCYRSSPSPSQYYPRSPITPHCPQQTRGFLTQLKRQSQTLKEGIAPSSASSLQEAPLQLTNLPYFVRRTASNQLPVYLVTKAGGTKQQTKIQKTEGDLEALRDDLARALGLDSGSKKGSDVTINRLNGHIIVKGWRKPEIQKFLEDRNF